MPLTISGAEGTFQWMKKKEDEMPIQVEPVKLQPILGMQPGLYLTIIYLVILLVVVFLVGVLPGILNSGKRVTFTSEVDPVVVHVDGTYVGSTPVTAFIEPGIHEAVFSHDGVGETIVSFETGHPVFFTWLFPRSQDVAASSFIDDDIQLSDYLHSMYDQVIAWSAVTDFSESYQRPPLFQQVARTVATLAYAEDQSIVQDFFLQSLNHMTSRTMVDDFTKALEMLPDVHIGEKAASILHLFDGEPTEKAGLQAKVGHVDYSRTALEIPLGSVAPITGFSYGETEFTMGRSVEHTYPGVQEMGMATVSGPFSIAALETSEYLWAQFIAHNPYWAKGNSEQLMADGMVDGNYLAGVYPTTSIVSTQPIRNVSWHAAQAFVSWLSELTGTQVFLPDQGQWELAAMSVDGKPYQNGTVATVDSKGPSAMLGGLWEFTSDPYVPLGRVSGIPVAWESDRTDIVIKGGSHLNDGSEIERATVGVVTRQTCAETIGFRIAWSR